MHRKFQIFGFPLFQRGGSVTRPKISVKNLRKKPNLINNLSLKKTGNTFFSFVYVHKGREFKHLKFSVHLQYYMESLTSINYKLSHSTQAGIFVKPKEGDALFWFNNGPKRNIDTRIFHMGCPVLYGNKWIANKWIKILAQFKDYPCWINKNHYVTAAQK